MFGGEKLIHSALHLLHAGWNSVGLSHGCYALSEGMERTGQKPGHIKWLKSQQPEKLQSDNMEGVCTIMYWGFFT